MYKSLSKGLFALLWFCMVTSCISDQKPNSDFTGEQQTLIRAFYSEQGSPIPGDYLITQDKNGNPYVYMVNWDNPYQGHYYLLVNDTEVHTAVLTETLNKLRACDRRFRGVRYAYNTDLRIDTIKIVTDSVIVLDELHFWKCNLTHLPPEVGNLRTSLLEIRDNRLAGIPIEMLNMASAPQPYDTLVINIYGPDQWHSQQVYDTLPTWAKDFLNKH